MPFCFVAVDAGHVELTFSGGHVDVERPVGFQERVVEVAMFYRVCSATLKMAASTVVPVGVLNMPGYMREVNFFVKSFFPWTVV